MFSVIPLPIWDSEQANPSTDAGSIILATKNGISILKKVVSVYNKLAKYFDLSQIPDIFT
jgi:hypothetical protein